MLRSNLEKYANNDGSTAYGIHINKPYLKHWTAFDYLLQYACIHPVRLDISGSWKPDWKSKFAVVKRRKLLNIFLREVTWSEWYFRKIDFALPAIWVEIWWAVHRKGSWEPIMALQVEADRAWAWELTVETGRKRWI